ncbi:MAG: DUF1800 domain-containing protein [Saprospiraceae bacterium]|nr:DUF1800 domain-containing protein [Saprospiraceae bacterium]
MNELPWQLKHFFHRAGFGIGIPELNSDVNKPIAHWVDESIHSAIQPIHEINQLQAGSPVVNSSLFGGETVSGLEPMQSASNQLDGLRAHWISHMSQEPSCLREKMSLFWHGHFACQCTTEIAAHQYLNIIRQNALGSFRKLLHGIAKSPAMILFLNNQQNRKERPNENFSRELMELFTMGRGTYQEQDVREGARAFSGWTTDNQGVFVFRENLHDFGQKTFLGKSGRFNGEDIIDIILEQEETPYFLASKIYRYFVNEVPNKMIIAQIARQIKNANYDLTSVMHFLFTSDFFYEKQHRGTRIKSPVELLVQISRLFGIRFVDDRDLAFLQKALGQLLFDPPNVAGWQGGRAWINNSTLMLRLNLVRYLINQERFDHAVSTPLEAMAAGETIQIIKINKDPSRLLELFSGVRYQQLEDVIKRSLLATETSPSIAKSKDFKEHDITQTLILKTVSLPEFQMS